MSSCPDSENVSSLQIFIPDLQLSIIQNNTFYRYLRNFKIQSLQKSRIEPFKNINSNNLNFKIFDFPQWTTHNKYFKVVSILKILKFKDLDPQKSNSVYRGYHGNCT